MSEKPALAATTHATWVLRRVKQELQSVAFSFSDEKDLHRGVGQVLDQAGLQFQHEFVAGADRFDFLVADTVVLEAKIKGSAQDALRQAARYAARPEITGVALVVTTAWGRRLAERYEVHGKPIFVIPIKRISF